MSSTYDIFITHAWRYHQDWKQAADLINGIPDFKWRNFSVPWYDPALDPNTPLGAKFVNQWLENQIIPCQAVIYLDGVRAVKSARKWLDLEVEFAQRHGKPIIALPAIGQDRVKLTDLPDDAGMVSWNAAELIDAIVRCAEFH